MGELKRRGKVWWIRYYRDGRRFEESSRSTRKDSATRLLKLREGDIAKGLPVSPAIGRLRYDEAIADVLADYRTNNRRSVDELQRRIDKHLTPYFGGRRMADITSADVRAYVAERQAETETIRRAHTVTTPSGTVRHVPEHRRQTGGASNGEINRELTVLKRAYTLAIQAGRLMARPHIALLRENNARSGFFDVDQFASVRAHLPEALRPVVTFAYITGWRVPSEVLTLQWSQVDLKAGVVRLEPNTTKNDEARVFPLTAELRSVLEAQRAAADDAQRQCSRIVPWVFFRMVARGRGGMKEPKPIKAFHKAWRSATVAAGCPGRIPHDFRRTAVRNHVRAGIPERVAQKLTGHKTRSVFERYNIVSEGDLFDAARKLDAFASNMSRNVAR